ncbi:hypothetical protein [Paraburkholderia strydomiana]|uniref:hypothetical protein n=1 Tax=Paraburkholderia strydomiana TaxID=1245417 RepID=UPI0038BBAA49
MSVIRLILTRLYFSLYFGLAAAASIAEAQDAALTVAQGTASYYQGGGVQYHAPPPRPLSPPIIIPAPPNPAPAPASTPIATPAPQAEQSLVATEYHNLDIPNYFLATKEMASESFEAFYSAFADKYAFSEDAQGVIGLIIVDVKTSAVITGAIRKPTGMEGAKLLSLNNERVITVIAIAVAPVIIAEVGTSLVALYAVNFWLGQVVKYFAEGLTWMMTFAPENLNTYYLGLLHGGYTGTWGIPRRTLPIPPVKGL